MKGSEDGGPSLNNLSGRLVWALPDRGSRCCAPGAPLCPGELQILEPAFGLSGCCGEGRARCPHLSLL